MNRHRKRLFGDASLLVYTTTPIDGEVVAGTFAKDWFAHRVDRTTVGLEEQEGGWQFQVKAADDWAASQAFMLKGVALTVDGRRWKVKKVEKPIGESLVWKVKAEIQ